MLSPVQSISFLERELDSVPMTVCLTNECIQPVLNCLKSFKGNGAYVILSGGSTTRVDAYDSRDLSHKMVPRYYHVMALLSCRSVTVCSALGQTFHFYRQVSRHVVVTINASKSDWGKGHAASGSWTGP